MKTMLHGTMNEPPGTGSKQLKMNPDAEIIHKFRQILDTKDVFCAHLELVADLLPDAIDPRDCLLLAQNIVPLVRRAHVFEESVIFPSILANNITPRDFAATLDRLRFEHLGDEEFANDLCVSLRQFVMDRSNSNVDALAWMLRGFFEGLRRHVAFEREFVLPLVTTQEK
jgi:hemerythrin-like domain-containing protein